MTCREEKLILGLRRNMSKEPRSSLPEIRLASEASAIRERVIHSIAVRLYEARLGAESIQNPVISYFIDMAIVEVRQMTMVHQETPRLQDGRKEPKVVQFLNSPAKDALSIR